MGGEFNLIIWLIILFIVLQPAIAKRMMLAARQRKIMQVEKERKSRVILVVHRQEQLSFLGIPFIRYITMADAEQVMRAIDLTDKDVPIDLVLHTPGGLVLAATQIARAINRREGKVRVIVPHYAMSGGTLIALAADEVIMSDHAVLGPLDPQIGQYPAPALMNLKRIKSYNEIEDDTLIKADMAAKATEQIEHSIEGLLQRHQDAATAQRTANMLTDGRWTHDYPITPDIAEQVLQLPVSREMPKQVLELMSLYRSAHQNQGVEYLPFRRGKETDASTNATIRWQ